ncbi:hypothetical protein PHLCEN_2v6064, partial [Hermanssonia centrifuga]
SARVYVRTLIFCIPCYLSAAGSRIVMTINMFAMIMVSAIQRMIIYAAGTEPDNPLQM